MAKVMAMPMASERSSLRLAAMAAVTLIYLIPTVAAGASGGDPLPSWNEGATRSAIVEFVERVTTEGSAHFVPPPERIATFDNDGTLWSEQPVYFQGLFALERIRAIANEHPEWRSTEPFRSAVAGEMQALLATGEAGLMEVLLAAHSDITADEFEASVRNWLEHARHPTTGMAFTRMIYQPMLELLGYLRANGFKTFIVSGGGVDFMRVFSEDVYGVPPEQVIGTAIGATYQMREGVPTIVKTGELVQLDDRAGKPVGIYRSIGRRPILAAGNSDGDLQMLQYTTIPRDAEDRQIRLGLIVHHTDAEREFAYDRDSSMGRLDEALDAADRRGWVVIDMKEDWGRVYPRD